MTYVVQATLNPADKGANTILNAARLSVTSTGRGFARSVTKVSSGKWYVEITRASSANWMFGLSNSVETLSFFPGQSTNSIGIYQGSIYYNGSVVETVSALNTTGVFGMAIDADARTVRFFNASGTTTSRAIGLTGDIYLAVGADSGAPPGSVTLNSNHSAFTYSLPSGFTAGFQTQTLYGFEGVVTDAAGAFAARTVRAYLRSSGALVGEVVSNATTGAYVLLPEPNSTAALTVEFLPVSTSENAIIFDRVVPA